MFKWDWKVSTNECASSTQSSFLLETEEGEDVLHWQHLHITEGGFLCMLAEQRQQTFFKKKLQKNPQNSLIQFAHVL